MAKSKVTLFFFMVLVFFNVSLAKENQTIPELKIGWYFPSINNRVSRTDFQVALEFWFAEFNKSISIQHTETRLFEQIDEMRTAFDNGELNLIIAPPLLLVQHFDPKMLVDGFIGVNKTGKPYGVVILARKDKNIKAITDFKNKRLVMPENDELAKVFLDSLIISQFHQNYQQIFGSIQLHNKQNSIVHSLFFDQADVGVVYLETFHLMGELNPQINETIKIIKTFSTDSPNYSFFHYQYPNDYRKKIIAEILKLNHSVRAQAIFDLFRMASIAECPVQSLEPIIRLNTQYNFLLQQIN